MELKKWSSATCLGCGRQYPEQKQAASPSQCFIHQCLGSEWPDLFLWPHPCPGHRHKLLFIYQNTNPSLILPSSVVTPPSAPGRTAGSKAEVAIILWLKPAVEYTELHLGGDSVSLCNSYLQSKEGISEGRDKAAFKPGSFPPHHNLKLLGSRPSFVNQRQ